MVITNDYNSEILLCIQQPIQTQTMENFDWYQTVKITLYTEHVNESISSLQLETGYKEKKNSLFKRCLYKIYNRSDVLRKNLDVSDDSKCAHCPPRLQFSSQLSKSRVIPDLSSVILAMGNTKKTVFKFKFSHQQIRTSNVASFCNQSSTNRDQQFWIICHRFWLAI